MSNTNRTESAAPSTLRAQWEAFQATKNPVRTYAAERLADVLGQLNRMDADIRFAAENGFFFDTAGYAELEAEYTDALELLRAAGGGC